MNDPKCDREAEDGCLHLHDNKCRPCKYYAECEYIEYLNMRHRKETPDGLVDNVRCITNSFYGSYARKQTDEEEEDGNEDSME